ncbi:hypothetical protein Z946_293 [Sulfitobacter noctilucicola]|nr:hypothetical protein Z946_293 [Sulfitobacter noctilucicola]
MVNFHHEGMKHGRQNSSDNRTLLLQIGRIFIYRTANMGVSLPL